MIAKYINTFWVFEFDQFELRQERSLETDLIE